jgi:HK97 family phage major capsid protein
LRRLPFNTRLVTAATGFDAAWVGEGKGVPLSKASYDEATLSRMKLAALCVVSNELLESTDPAAELLIRNDLASACVGALNTSFLDPSNSGSAGVEPASITDGVTGISASGDGLTDIRNLIDVFPGDLERAVLIGSASSFAALHDPIVLPNLGVRGGDALGIPAIPTEAAGDNLILVDPDGIALGEAEMTLKVSTQGSIEMSDAPTMDAVAPTGAATVSLFQTNSTAIMAEKVVAWEVARPSVAFVEGIATS